MIRRELEFLGREASVICLGTAYFGTTISESLSFEILDAYVSMGGNFLDTARLYGFFDDGVKGVSEDVIGRWMQSRSNRRDIILATKGAHPNMKTMNVSRLDRQSLTDDLNRSLEALRTDAIDIYWLHRDDKSIPVGDILDTLNLFASEKKILSFGCSCWSPERIAQANLYAREHGLLGFSANEPQWSLARQMYMEDETLYQMDKPTYELHLKTGMPCVPFSSQAQGFFIKLHDMGLEKLSDKAKRRFLHPHNLRLYEEAEKISARTHASIGAVQLAYLSSQPFPVFPIVGVSNPGQMEVMREAGELKLDADCVALLTELAGF